MVREQSLTSRPWTWWIFYLGYFLLGWGLRGVVLRRGRLVAATLAMVAVGLVTVWQWRNPAAPRPLQTLSPVSYFGLGVHVYAVLVYLVVQSTVRQRAALSFLASGRAARVGRTLGDATLGVFALHLAVIHILRRVPGVGGAPAASSSEQLVARVLLVVVVTYALVLVLRRVPGLRRVL